MSRASSMYISTKNNREIVITIFIIFILYTFTIRDTNWYLDQIMICAKCYEQYHTEIQT